MQNLNANRTECKCAANSTYVLNLVRRNHGNHSTIDRYRPCAQANASQAASVTREAGPSGRVGSEPSHSESALVADIDSAATPNERAMLFWLDTAARFHTDPVRDVIVALRTVEQPATRPGEAPLLYVWEVAWHRDPEGIKWLFIVWDVSGYSVRFHPCASRAEAMTLFEQPVVGDLAAIASTASGVFLRPDVQPR